MDLSCGNATVDGDLDVTGTISGSLGVAIRTSTSSPITILAASDQVVLADATLGPIVVDLPSAVGLSGRYFTVKKIDAVTLNAVTVTPAATELIDGAVTYPLTTQYASVTFVSNGAGWWII